MVVVVGKRPLLSNVRASLSCWRFQSVHGTVRRCGWPVSGIVHSWPAAQLVKERQARAKQQAPAKSQEEGGDKAGVRDLGRGRAGY